MDLIAIQNILKYFNGQAEVEKVVIPGNLVIDVNPIEVLADSPCILLHMEVSYPGVGSSSAFFVYDEPNAASVNINTTIPKFGSHVSSSSSMSPLNSLGGKFPPMLFENGISFRVAAGYEYNNPFFPPGQTYADFQFWFIRVSDFNSNNVDFNQVISSLKKRYMVKEQKTFYNSITNISDTIVNNTSGFITGMSLNTIDSPGNAQWVKFYDAAVPGDVDPATDQPILQIYMASGNGGSFNEASFFPIPFYFGLQVRSCTGFADTDNTAAAVVPREVTIFYNRS